MRRDGDIRGSEGAASLLRYPLEYEFKVIGHAADDFAEHARRLVEQVVGGARTEQVRTSSGGRYHSVSVLASLDSEAQRRAVYQALHDDERVVYYL